MVAGPSNSHESMSRTPIRDALKWLSSAPANPYTRHSREGGNPRTNIPRNNANCDTTTYVHTATPLRLSGNCAPLTHIHDRNPEEVYGWQMTRRQLHSSTPRFSYLGTKMMLRGFESASESHQSSVSSFRRRPESREVGRGECSAVEDFARRGACPPLGPGWGVAESAVPIRRTKPQLQLFIPWCAGQQPA